MHRHSQLDVYPKVPPDINQQNILSTLLGAAVRAAVRTKLIPVTRAIKLVGKKRQHA